MGRAVQIAKSERDDVAVVLHALDTAIQGLQDNTKPQALAVSTYHALSERLGGDAGVDLRGIEGEVRARALI